MERKEALMEQALPDEELEKAVGGAKCGEYVKFFCRTCNKTIQDETIKYPPALTPPATSEPGDESACAPRESCRTPGVLRRRHRK